MAGELISDGALDALLDYVKNAENLYLCSQAPTTYTEAQTTYKLATKATPTFSANANDTSGRKTEIQTFTDGTVDSTGTATHWALTDNSASELIAVGEMTSSQVLTSGNDLELTAVIPINAKDAVGA